MPIAGTRTADRFDNVQEVVDELVSLRLVDIDEDDFVIHDWDDHQPLQGGPSDEPEAVRDRKRVSRSRLITTSHDQVTTDKRRGEETRPEVSSHDSPSTYVAGATLGRTALSVRGPPNGIGAGRRDWTTTPSTT
jgi:hypothetical protein